MRLWTGLSIFLLVHALAIVLAAGWLYGSGRLSRERLQRVRDLFALTLEEEERQQAQAEEEQRQAHTQAEEAAYLQAVANGLTPVAQRLERQQRAEELQQQKLERAQRTLEDLARRLQLERQRLTEEREQFARQRDAYEADLQARTAQLTDEDFTRAVTMYEQLRPGQVKAMFQALMSAGRLPEVVDYLAAMQPRKAAAVLKEFDAPADIELATRLVQELRHRGVRLDDEQEGAT